MFWKSVTVFVYLSVIASGVVSSPIDLAARGGHEVEPVKVEPPKHEPIKLEPAKHEPPKYEPPKHEPPKHEPPKHEPPKHEPIKLTSSLHVTPTPSHIPPSHVPPPHVKPSHVPDIYAPPPHVTPSHVPDVYAPPPHIPPTHVTPSHIPPSHVPPPHFTPSHIAPPHVPSHITLVPKPHFTTIHTPPPHFTSVHVPAPSHVPVHVSKPPHFTQFDNWGGFKALNRFDNFHGVKNFDGHDFKQVFVKDNNEHFCRARDVHIVQQRLLVLQEMAKRIIIEHICEVEVQTIVFEQYFGRLHNFGRDLRRVQGGHQVGFDRHISGHFSRIIDQKGDLTFDDWNFGGHDLGKQTVLVKGHNWNDANSPQSVDKAFRVSRDSWTQGTQVQDFFPL